MPNIQGKSFFFFIISFITNIFLVLYVLISIEDNSINDFFNSDCLYLPFIFKELFINHNPIQGTFLSPAPGFFPDMFFYFALMMIFQNFTLCTMLYALFQYTALLLLLFFILKTINGDISYLHFTVANLCMTLFFLTTTISNDFIFTFYLISNSYHLGSFVMTLLCLFFTFRFFRTGNYNNIIFLLLLGTLSVVSDRIFIVWFSFPLTMTCLLMLNKQNFRKLLLIIFCNSLIVFIGLWSFEKIKNSGILFIGEPHKIFNYELVFQSFNNLTCQMKIYFAEGSIKTIIIWLAVASFISTLFISVKNYIVYRQDKIPLNSSSYLFLGYSLFCVFFTCIVFISPIINGSYTGFDTIRYIMPVFYLSVFNAGMLIVHFLKNQQAFKNIFYSVVVFYAVALIFLFFTKKPFDRIHRFINYYPEKVADMDSIAYVHDLHNGVSGFWDAKFITMFSKKNLRVYAVFDAITPYFHATNSSWFYTNDTTIQKQPLFNFVIPDKINDKSFFKKIFGDSCLLIKTKNISVYKVFNFRFDKITYLPVKQN